MTPTERRQRAEELARKLKVGKTVPPPSAAYSGWPDFYADVPWNDGVSWIESALSDAYTEGRREQEKLIRELETQIRELAARLDVCREAASRNLARTERG